MTLENVNRKLAGLIRRCTKGGFIIRSRNRALFSQLAGNQEFLTSYFGQMGADLVLNETLGIAYIQPNAEIEEELEYKLGRTITLGSWETLLLVFLRQRRFEHFTGDAEHEAPWVSLDQMRKFLAEYSIEKEDRLFQKRFQRAIDRLTELQVLLSTESLEEFEISPACDILLPGDRITELKSRAATYFSKRSDESEGKEPDEAPGI